MTAGEFAELLERLKLLEEDMIALTGVEVEAGSPELERRRAAVGALDLVGRAIVRLTERAYADRLLEQEARARSPKNLKEKAAAIWARKAEERARLHVDWKRDVRAVDGGHCFGVEWNPEVKTSDPRGEQIICKERAAWEVDDISYCDRHLVMSER